MRKRFSLILVTLLLASTFPPPSLATSEYCTIHELQQQATQSWHNTYETKWRTIQIDADILIPEVDALPVVRFQENATPYPIEDRYFSNHTNTPGIFMTYNSPTLTDQEARYTEERKPGTFPQEIYHRNPWELAKAYAASNPLTLQAAIDFLDELFDSTTGGNVQPYVTDVITAQWVEKKRNLDGSAKPYRDMGYYNLTFTQAFHGIPLMRGVKPTKYSKDWKTPLAPMGNFWVASRNEFRLDLLFPREELGILIVDVPVLPLEKIIPVYEKLIMDGYVRDVASLEFGYAPFWETKEYTTLVAYPCWFLVSEFETNPKRERAGFFSESENYTPNPVLGNEYVVIVNAQTGELFDPFSISQEDTYVPNIITWDDVGGRP